jgi:rubredoxin
MDKYICSVCSYVYDPVDGAPENGIAFGTTFRDLPDDWLCSGCGSPKSDFEAAHSSETTTQTSGRHTMSFWKKIFMPRPQAHSAPAGKQSGSVHEAADDGDSEKV